MRRRIPRMSRPRSLRSRRRLLAPCCNSRFPVRLDDRIDAFAPDPGQAVGIVLMYKIQQALADLAAQVGGAPRILGGYQDPPLHRPFPCFEYLHHADPAIPFLERAAKALPFGAQRLE